MKSVAPTLFGGVLLIMGSCLGAGMLATPIASGVSGYLPTMVTLVVIWLYMLISGIYLVELGKGAGESYSLLTLVDTYLGRKTRYVCFFLYLSLFYSILTAYVINSGIHMQYLLLRLGLHANSGIACSLAALFFGIATFLGTGAVDLLNRALMAVKLCAFVLLLSTLGYSLKTEYYFHSNFLNISEGAAFLVLSFGFHNMIPPLQRYFSGKFMPTLFAVIYGSIAVCIVYALWITCALGVLSPESIAIAKDSGIDVATALSEFVSSPYIGVSAEICAFTALMTSFIAQTLALVDFWGDGLSRFAPPRYLLIIITLLFPLCGALYFPSLFYAVLGFAGGAIAVALFGVMPPLLYRKKATVHGVDPYFSLFRTSYVFIFMMTMSSYLFLYQCGVVESIYMIIASR